MPVLQPEISVVIPTLNAAGWLPAQIGALRMQSLPPAEIILVDSQSDDGTPALAEQLGCRVIPIRRDQFRHGRARNWGAQAARGNLLVFLTQDALPASDSFLAELTRPLALGEAQAATARQCAPSEADPLEIFARGFNYPPESNRRCLSDLPSLGVKAFFFSNSASAVLSETFRELGGFSETVIVNEDMHFCARLLRMGGCAAYTAEARVWHAHRYTLRSVLARYFDIGVFFQDEQAVLAGARAGGEGAHFALSQLNFLLKTGAWGRIPAALGQTAAKAAGFWLGRHSSSLPLRWKRSLSGQKAYWQAAPPAD